MLRIEVSASSNYRSDQARFEKILRRRILVLLNDALAECPHVEINRIQFIKPRVK